MVRHYDDHHDHHDDYHCDNLDEPPTSMPARENGVVLNVLRRNGVCLPCPPLSLALPSLLRYRPLSLS